MRAFILSCLVCAFVSSAASRSIAQDGFERPIIVRGNELLRAFDISLDDRGAIRADLTAFRGYSWFDVDGTLHSNMGNGLGPSWAPDGTRIAVLQPWRSLLFPVVYERSGDAYPLFASMPPEGTYLYRTLWSPTGESIALIRYGPRGFAFVVVDVETGELISEAEIPERFTAHWPYYEAGFDTFAWSPDGLRVLLSWQGVLVFDVASGEVHVASDDFALAFWSPDSDGVCLLQYQREFPDPVVLGQLQRYDLTTGEFHLVATQDEIRLAGIDRASWLTTGSILLSPGGTSVALSMGNTRNDRDAIRIYDASPNCIDELNQPRQIIDTSLVSAMDWSPDGRALVVIEEVLEHETPTLGQMGGSNFRFAARVIDLETQVRVTLEEYDFEGVEVDMPGIVGLLAWSR